MVKTYKQLLAEKRELDAQIAAAQHAERDEALATIRELMSRFDIGADELVVKRGPRKSGPLPAKYRDPASGATWSGKGREPGWLVGKDRAPFTI